MRTTTHELVELLEFAFAWVRDDETIALTKVPEAFADDLPYRVIFERDGAEARAFSGTPVGTAAALATRKMVAGGDSIPEMEHGWFEFASCELPIPLSLDFARADRRRWRALYRLALHLERGAGKPVELDVRNRDGDLAVEIASDAWASMLLIGDREGFARAPLPKRRMLQGRYPECAVVWRQG